MPDFILRKHTPQQILLGKRSHTARLSVNIIIFVIQKFKKMSNTTDNGVLEQPKVNLEFNKNEDSNKLLLSEVKTAISEDTPGWRKEEYRQTA